MLFRNIQGQGLLEAVVATAVIVGGLSGVIALAGRTVRVSNISSQQVVAINLAREGIEIVRNIRDSNWLDDAKSWNDNLDTPDTTAIPVFDEGSGTWSLDYTPDSMSAASAAVYKNTTSGNYEGMYRQELAQPVGYSATPFSRLVTINAICDDDIDRYIISGSCGGTVVGYRVLSQVQWTEVNDNTRNISIEERLFNWK